MFNRLMRSPEGSESAGAAVIEAPETAAPEQVTPETPVAEAPKVEKPKATDWERYQRMQDKYARNPDAKATKVELELQRKYEGKDESLIDGYQKAKKGTQDEDDEPAAKPKSQEPEEVEADPDEPILKLVGAKDKAQLPAKIQGLVNEVKKLSGERGEIGRVLKETGVGDLKALASEVKGARALNQLVQDLKAGKAEAFAYIGVNNQRAPEQYTGEIPEGVLDDGLFKHIAPKLKAANDRADALEKELRAMQGKLEPWERSQAENAAVNERTAQVNNVVSEVTKLTDGVEGLWDSKKSGPLSKALQEYYATDGEFHPDLKPILEIIDIAKTHNLDNLEIALAYWERKNGGSLIAKARADAREPFLGKKPNVGLSDRQGNHNGQFKSYTEASLKERADKGQGFPPEFLDRDGTVNINKMPVHLRHLAT